MNDRLDLELKIGGVDDVGEFTGIASVFGELDLMGDRVERGAFTKSLATHKRAGRSPLMLWSHQLDQPIGKWTSITETAEGLTVKGKLLLDVARAREVYSMLREKIVDGLSIGFRTVKSQRMKTGRLLQEIDLAEISLVTLPALASARVTSVKSNGGRRSIPLKDPSMSDDTYDDGAVETAAAELPPEVIERFESLETKLATIEDIPTRLDKIETRLARPSARIEVKEDQAALEQKAFNSFLRRGVEHMPELERKVLTTMLGSPADGGYWTVPEVFVAEMMRNLVEFSPLRSVARTMTVSGTPVKLPKRTSNLAASWVAEGAEHDLSEPAYAQQEIDVFEMRVSVEITNALMEDSAFNMASELATDIGEAFGLLESTSFVTGSGVGEPEGFLTSSAFTTISGEGVTADRIIDLFYSVPDRYAARGTWLMRRESQGAVRKLRSATDGPFIWADSLIPGQPATLLGRPVLEFPDMAIAGGSPAEPVVAFGDWARAYRVTDRTGLEILRDPYAGARRSVVTFHARRRTGGAVVDGVAVKGLNA
jgi:HK97 family phage major capsid protein/HK97 family phage prohead protease